MSSWKELRVADTIYEEEYEHSSSPPSLSLSDPSSPPTPLHSRVESWSLATGRKTDVLIYVKGTCFHLHKDPLTSRSSYLRRQLAGLSEITLTLNITPETFALVADFCYGTHVVITPFNVVPLRIAAELLGMTETNGKHEQNLNQITETYFLRAITFERELVRVIFCSCLRLLPEAETTAFLVSRCVEALNSTGESDEMLDGCVDDVINLATDDFQIVGECMQCRFESHDALYRIVDLYIQEHSSTITEEQKIEICNFIDCDKLSTQCLIHAVQNPRLPLRFIVRAMLVEQLNTRRTVLTTPTTANHHYTRSHQTGGSMTLGSILRRDAAVREAAQLKVEMDSTNSRIESLEKELSRMKKLLRKSEKKRSLMEKKPLQKSEVETSAVMKEKGSHKSEKLLLESEEEIRRVLESSMHKISHKSVMEERSLAKSSSRSASFHHELRDANKIEKGERGSASFSGFRPHFGREKMEGSSRSKFTGNECPRTSKNNINGKGLIDRLKRTLWVSKSDSKCNGKYTNTNDGNGEKDVGVTKDEAPFHKRTRSTG
ncbi:PREDICTED: BTB/POZ domain-containing protein At3g49900 [Populus euphratica]|uniref:BTB/POZ domain-containing protein At3g49900 n=1 Tax=Populus euphratica TaxID=75702 RepID=A0AAJ6T846_POPEU|nr:PREDICTED: BTB/POZ domain-containing protein At3g49900 [Populus euphratica]